MTIRLKNNYVVATKILIFNHLLNSDTSQILKT